MVCESKNDSAVVNHYDLWSTQRLIVLDYHTITSFQLCHCVPVVLLVRHSIHSQSKNTAGSVFSSLPWLGLLCVSVFSACCGNTHRAMPHPHVHH